MPTAAGISVWTNDVPGWEPWIPPNAMTSEPKDLRYWDGRMCKFVKPWAVIYDGPEMAFRMLFAPKFKTNGGSIPKFAHDRIDPFGIGILAFFVHDALFGGHYLPLDLSNLIMLNLLKYVGMNPVWSHVAWLAVQLAGKPAYSACDERWSDSRQMFIEKETFEATGKEEEDTARMRTRFLLYRCNDKLRPRLGHLLQHLPTGAGDRDPDQAWIDKYIPGVQVLPSQPLN